MVFESVGENFQKLPLKAHIEDHRGLAVTSPSMPVVSGGSLVLGKCGHAPGVAYAFVFDMYICATCL